MMNIYIEPKRSEWTALVRRVSREDTAVEERVREILGRIRDGGDPALAEIILSVEGVLPASLTVSEAEFREAESAVPDALKDAIRTAYDRIRTFHESELPKETVWDDGAGIVCRRRFLPIRRVGLYIPGGTAPLFSTVLMLGIPAAIAGCPERVLCTPPGKDGKIDPAILAAAKIAGADRIVKAGGAQAIAAMAYGTESVPKVDKIVGPGNAFVAEAKRQVYGVVSIDMIAGPSEILVAADGKSNPAHLAADLLSQAEHDKVASAVLVTDSMEMAEKVRDELERQIPLLERGDIARVSIDNNGKIIVAEDLRTVIDIANEIAPEHLELCVDNPFDWLDSIRHAGSVFMGRNCPEALGDYLAGPNHTLPTQGTAKFSSPLSVDDFVKKTQYTYFTKEALAAVAEDVAAFARMEGLTGHARSALIRTQQ